MLQSVQYNTVCTIQQCIISKTSVPYSYLKLMTNIAGTCTRTN